MLLQDTEDTETWQPYKQIWEAELCSYLESEDGDEEREVKWIYLREKVKGFLYGDSRNRIPENLREAFGIAILFLGVFREKTERFNKRVLMVADGGIK